MFFTRLRIRFIVTPEAELMQNYQNRDLFKALNTCHYYSRGWNHAKLCKHRFFYKAPNPFHCHSRGWIYAQMHQNCCFAKFWINFIVTPKARIMPEIIRIIIKNDASMPNQWKRHLKWTIPLTLSYFLLHFVAEGWNSHQKRATPLDVFFLVCYGRAK